MTAPKIRRRTRTRRRDGERAGTTSVEFALILPVIFLIFLGSLEIVGLNHLRNMANHTSYDAARTMIMPGKDSKEAKQEVQETLSKVGIRDADIQINESSDTVDVRVSIPIKGNTWVTGNIFKGNEITQRCVMRKTIKSRK